MDQPAAAPAAQPSLMLLLAIVEPWGEALYAALDGRARLALAHTSPEFRQWALTAAAQTTLSLLAYGGLSEAAWEQRFARAQQALAVRAQHGRADNTLVLRLPSPHPAALQALLSIPASAGSAVSALHVRQGLHNPGTGPSEAVNTQWLHGLGAAFPNLRILRVSRLAGCLPPPTHLPHLRELQVCLCPIQTSTGQAAAASSTAATCASQPPYAASSSAVGSEPAAGHSLQHLAASIAPYLAQITNLDMSLSQPNSRDDWASVWPHLLTTTTTTTTLQRLICTGGLTDELIKRVCRYAPALQHISCERVEQDGHDHSAQSWSVQELHSTGISGALLIKLPQSPHKLMVTDRSHVCFTVGAEGLFESQTQRLDQWEFTLPCRVQLQPQQGVTSARLTSALQRLATAVPAGAVIDIGSHRPVDMFSFEFVAGPLAAAAELYPDISFLAPMLRGDSVAVLQSVEPPVAHVRVQSTRAEVPRRWESLHIVDAGLTDVLRVPEQSKGPYQLSFDSLSENEYVRKVKQLSSYELSELNKCLPHTTFTVPRGARIRVVYTDGLYLTSHPAGKGPEHQLATYFNLLGTCQWRVAPDCHSLELSLHQWTLTPSLIQTLANPPSFDIPCKLILGECGWALASECDYSELVRVVPRCSSTWCLSAKFTLPGREACTVEHIKAICTGAAARGEACDRLRLKVVYRADRTDCDFTDAQRSEVAAHIDEQGLGRWVEDIAWAPCGPPQLVHWH